MNDGVVPIAAADVVENIAVDTFTPGAHWELLEPSSDDVVVEDVLTVEGQTFLPPNIPRGEDWGSSSHAPQKRITHTHYFVLLSSPIMPHYPNGREQVE